MTKRKNRSSKSISKEILKLENKIKTLKRKRVRAKNKEAEKTAKQYVVELTDRVTPAELHFGIIARQKKLDLKFQYPIYIKKGNEITQFFIADFYDEKRKIIFEIDGGYHDTEQQKILDAMRTKILRKNGYGVYRISNEDVFAGKTTAFLYNVYKGIGYDILNKT